MNENKKIINLTEGDRYVYNKSHLTFDVIYIGERRNYDVFSADKIYNFKIISGNDTFFRQSITQDNMSLQFDDTLKLSNLDLFAYITPHVINKINYLINNVKEKS